MAAIFIGSTVMGQQKKLQEQPTDSDREVLTCQLIQKPFINKGGRDMGYKEYFLRCSIQDYFIKWCESDLKPEDVEAYLDSGISVEVEIHQGNWDICPEDGHGEVQSRGGRYVTLHKIVE